MKSKLLTRLETSAVYPAHIRGAGNEAEIQTVQAHCEETAEFAKQALDGIGLGTTAQLAGQLHDLGKLTSAYRKYLVDGFEGRPVHRGSVNHTFAGVRLVLDHICTENTDFMSKIAAEHTAYAIGAHHGLFDCVDENGESGFDWRRVKDDSVIQEGIHHFLKICDLHGLQTQLKKAGQEISQFYKSFPDMKDRFFYSHLVTRMLLSAVIEGDRRSTAEFLQPDRPQPIQASYQLWDECLFHLESKLKLFPMDTPVKRGRNNFSELCRDFADNPSGIYRLNMPTGAGKTLSSLRYALAHGKQWNKKHIFFVMPLLAIIDQNAQVLKDYIGREDILLEHHSNILSLNEDSELDARELLIENWDAPIVITTLVQFLNTMFSHKTASIRRFHSLCNSVIVLDEVQTVPPKMLSLFNQAIAFLASNCGATVILCSATQPALEYAQRPLPVTPPDIVPHDPQLWEPFCRTVIQPIQAMNLTEIADFAAALLQEKSSLLIICNKKGQASELYQLLQTEDASCFHLSASMCMAHRRDILAVMETAKKHGKVLCVSTQIMEAGIDTSFDCVIRLQAGMDSIIQAAGRCNRNGDSPLPSPVYVIRCKGENLSRLTDIQAGRDAAAELFSDPLADYASPQAIETYYRIYYRNQKCNFQDYYSDALGHTLYELLGKNTSYLRSNSQYFLNQAYKTACAHFQVFDDDTVDAVVPYGDGVAEIQNLCNGTDDFASQLKKLKPYTISLYRYQQEFLEKQGALTSTPDGILVLEADWYDKTLGLVLSHEMTFLEV